MANCLVGDIFYRFNLFPFHGYMNSLQSLDYLGFLCSCRKNLETLGLKKTGTDLETDLTTSDFEFSLSFCKESLRDFASYVMYNWKIHTSTCLALECPSHPFECKICNTSVNPPKYFEPGPSKN